MEAMYRNEYNLVCVTIQDEGLRGWFCKNFEKSPKVYIMC